MPRSIPSEDSNKNPSPITFSEVIDCYDKITEAEIQALRADIIESLVPSFDKMPSAKKKFLTVLYKRGFEELFNVSNKRIYMPGFHDFRNDIQFLLSGVETFIKKQEE